MIFKNKIDNFLNFENNNNLLMIHTVLSCQNYFIKLQKMEVISKIKNSTRCSFKQNLTPKPSNTTTHKNSEEIVMASCRKKYLNLQSVRGSYQMQFSYKSNKQQLSSRKNIKPIKTILQFQTYHNEKVSVSAKMNKLNIFFRILNINSVRRVLFEYLEVKTIIKIYKCSVLQTTWKKKQQLIQYIMKSLIQNKQNDTMHKTFIIYYTYKIHDHTSFHLYSHVPCKIIDQIEHDTKLFKIKLQTSQQKINQKSIINVARSLRVKNPQFQYNSSILSIINNLLDKLSQNEVFLVLDHVLKKLGLIKLYSSKKMDTHFMTIIEGFVKEYDPESTLNSDSKNKLLTAIYSKWLKPLFSDIGLSIQSWDIFFKMYLIRGWKIVLQFLAFLIRESTIKSKNNELVSVKQRDNIQIITRFNQSKIQLNNEALQRIKNIGDDDDSYKITNLSIFKRKREKIEISVRNFDMDHSDKTKSKLIGKSFGLEI